MNLAFRISFCGTKPSGIRWKKLRAGTLVVTMISTPCFAQDGASSPSGAFRPDKATSVTPVNQLPDAHTQWEGSWKRMQAQRFAKANLERKRQMDEDSARLLQLAAELNAVLGVAGQDGLPPTAIGKAEIIEKLAHAVKEKMKLTVAN